MSIKKLTVIITLFSGMLFSVLASANADFTLVNGTGFDIREVYISPTKRNSWGRDRLGKDTLDNGKSRLFTFSDNANCNQDIKVVFDDDDSEIVWNNLNLCELDKITLRYNRRTKEISAVKE